MLGIYTAHARRFRVMKCALRESGRAELGNFAGGRAGPSGRAAPSLAPSRRRCTLTLAAEGLVSRASGHSASAGPVVGQSGGPCLGWKDRGEACDNALFYIG